MKINGDLIISDTDKKLKDALTTITESDLPATEYFIASGGNHNVTKTVNYGGVDCPLDTINTSNDFYITNNRVYYRGSKTALVHVDYFVETESSFEGYFLFGGTNGGYVVAKGLIANVLGAKEADGSMLMTINPGNYFTILVGCYATFSNMKILSTKMRGFVIDYI